MLYDTAVEYIKHVFILNVHMHACNTDNSNNIVVSSVPCGAIYIADTPCFGRLFLREYG